MTRKRQYRSTGKCRRALLHQTQVHTESFRFGSDLQSEPLRRNNNINKKRTHERLPSVIHECKISTSRKHGPASLLCENQRNLKQVGFFTRGTPSLCARKKHKQKKKRHKFRLRMSMWQTTLGSQECTLVSRLFSYSTRKLARECPLEII